MAKNSTDSQRNRIPRPSSELKQLLNEHLDVLIALCEQYDLKKRHFSAEIALNLRVLFHHHQNGRIPSISLLHQAGLEKTNLLDTTKTILHNSRSLPVETYHVAPAAGLALLCVRESNGAMFIECEPSISAISSMNFIGSQYSSWWNSEILTSANGSKFSRKRIVTQMANQDRGAHVAPGIEKAYFELTRNADLPLQIAVIHGDAVTNLNMSDNSNNLTFPVRDGLGVSMARSLVRQIAHETLSTLLPPDAPYHQAAVRRANLAGAMPFIVAHLANN